MFTDDQVPFQKIDRENWTWWRITITAESLDSEAHGVLIRAAGLLMAELHLCVTSPVGPSVPSRRRRSELGINVD